MLDVATTVLGAIQASIECAKSVKEAMKAVKEIDQKIAFQTMREQQSDLIDTLLDAKEKIRELQAQLTLKEQMEHHSDGNIMWRVENGTKCGPYCSTCYGDAGKAIPLSESDRGAWHCPKCKNHFHTREWDEKQKQRHQQLNRQLGGR